MTREEAINIVRNIYQTDKEKEALATLIPELAESEDERIRKALIEVFKKKLEKGFEWVEYGIPNRSVLDWLEKQKDLTTENIYKHSRERMSFWDGQQKEQKPAESISQLTVQGKGVYKICPRCKERMVRDDSMVYTSMPPQYRYECPKCGESECDTVMYDNPEMEEQKPAEWSKEDESFLDSIEDAISSYYDLNHAPQYHYWLEEKLKSLRPQPKQDVLPSLSEKEIIFLKRALDYLRKGHNRYGGEDFTNEIAVLEWLITHPILVSDTHWKPSEEQMEAFKKYIEEFHARAEAAVGGWNNFDVMIRLYEQLKKL